MTTMPSGALEKDAYASFIERYIMGGSKAVIRKFLKAMTYFVWLSLEGFSLA